MRKNIECYPDPESRLGQQPKASRIRKSQRDYQERMGEIEKAWPGLAGGALGEALRFQADFSTELAKI
jgi:hypothetical protein